MVVRAGSCSDVRRDVDGLMASSRWRTPLLAPVHEPRDRPVVGLAGVGVADGDGEEVDEAPDGAVVRRCDHGGSRSANAASGPAGVP